jgi:hypothetical protein
MGSQLTLNNEQLRHEPIETTKRLLRWFRKNVAGQIDCTRCEEVDRHQHVAYC